MKLSPKRILIVNVNWLGDALFASPAIRALRVAFPDSFIASVSHRRAVPVYRRNPHLDEAFAQTSGFLLDIAARKFDTVIFFHASRTKAFWTALAGIPNRIGYQTEKNKFFLTAAVAPPAGPLHKVDYFLNLVNQIGVQSQGRESDFVLSGEAEEKIKGQLQKLGVDFNKPYAVVHAGGNWELKRWPADYFAKWIALFRSRYAWPVFLCGTPAEKKLAEKILKQVSDPAVVSVCGDTSLEELAVLMKNAALVLSNDSGPIHLAASQKSKVIGLFGPTRADLTGPVLRNKGILMQKDVGCETPCYYRACDNRLCMEWLLPEEVLKQATELLVTP